MTILREFGSSGAHLLTCELFVAGISDFQKRHPSIVSMSRSQNFPKDVGVQFVGNVERGTFILGYSLECAAEEACIDIGMRIGRANVNDGYVDERYLSLMTYRMHRDIPGTEDFFINAMPLVEDEPDDLSINIWTSLFPSDGVGLQDVDRLFDEMARVAPRVRTQFFPPVSMVYKKFL